MSDIWTLLIIDDCVTDRKIYRRYLLKDPCQSYKILEADSAAEGLAVCKQNHCDVILLDFCLPDMNGLDFLEKLKREISNTQFTVIMLTGHGNEVVAVEAMKQGVQDYLVKQHLKQDVLQLAVRNAVEKSYLQAQLSRTRERQRLIATTALRIRQSLDLEQILHTAVVEVHQLLKCNRVEVCQFLPEIASKINLKSYSSIQYICDEGNCYRAISHVYEAGISNCHGNNVQQIDSSANLIVPIVLRKNDNANSKIWGLLIAHESKGKPHWQVDEAEILREVSVQLAIAIQQAELLAQTQAALKKEQQLNLFKSQITATVSHEYRTPLTSILAAASTLSQHGHRLNVSKQQRFLRIIEQKARHLSKLVDDMLVINELDLDKTKFKSVPLDLVEYFSQLIEETRETTTTGHELILKITGNVQDFSGDGELLRLVFDNLISNAIKYSPNESQIEFHLAGKDSEIIFEVSDQGIGIPENDQTSLFQPFCRGSNVDTIPGTGLGLAIAKACVELHGGTIMLESQIAQGTKVTIRLPKEQDSVCLR